MRAVKRQTIEDEARSEIEAVNAGKAPHAAPLYVLFCLTGIGLVLPGTLLPDLQRRWGWQDGRSGVLFFLFFLGTSLGAFCARGPLGRMLLVGSLLIAGPLAVMAWLHGVPVFAAMLLAGLGLGIVMTSTTLLRSRQRPDDRPVEMTRLNLIWAVGACSAPTLLLESVARIRLAWVLQIYAAVVLLTGVIAALSQRSEVTPPEGQWIAWRRMRWLPAPLSISLPLSTGIEAGVGAWLTTYALREGGARHGVLSSVTALWAGLLLSRALFSSKRLRLADRRGASTGFATLVVCGLVLLLQAGPTASMVLGAFCVGFGIGPIYPLLLARMLGKTEAGNAGFLLAGAGSALLPFLIGQTSQNTHSLRLGLTVPLLGSFVLLLAQVHVARSFGGASAG